MFSIHSNRERKRADTNLNQPAHQMAQCQFPGLAIFNAKILIYFSNKIHGSEVSYLIREFRSRCRFQPYNCSVIPFVE